MIFLYVTKTRREGRERTRKEVGHAFPLPISDLETKRDSSMKGSEIMDLIIFYVVSIVPWCKVETILPNNPRDGVSHNTPCQVLPNAVILT